MKFIDLQEQYVAIRSDCLQKLDELFKKGNFILGEEVRNFEEEFASYCDAKYAVGVNSGTDALFLSLRCLGIGPGDEVIVPSFTFIATSFVVSCTGARPVFVDIDENTYAIDPSKIKKAITKKTKAIIPVHLFGLCADMPKILSISKAHALAVIEDAAQAHGAAMQGKMAGSTGTFGCFSFYPTKNLSAFGDAGLVTTNQKHMYKKLLQLRDCGRGKKRYVHSVVGYNSRLDTVQAAILRLKLKHIDEWNDARIKNAAYYSELLAGVPGVSIPSIPHGYRHVFHVYSIRTRKRKKLIETFQKYKIPSSIFYPLPLHLQPANRYLGYRRGDFPVAERVSQEILALPIHPSLERSDIEKVVAAIREVHRGV